MEKIFEAIIPGWTGVKMPKEFPVHVCFVLRASALLVQYYAITRHGLPFGMISLAKRVRIIDTLYHHPNAAIRSLVQFWKVTALMTQC